MVTMHKTTVLDVTLRDGGYQNNWDFSQEHAIEIVRLLVAAGIDHIEIGYRNSPPNEHGVKLTGQTPDDYVAAVREHVPTAKLAVMYAPCLVTETDLEKLAELGVSMVRCSLPHTSPEQGFPLIKRGHDLGMISTANMTNVTQYRLDDLVDLCNRVIDNGCDVIYIADSNGSMTPESVKSTLAHLQEQLHPVQLGFHNHNMLGMAMANAIEAIRMKVSYIDCTIRGMGRSAGNVPTESLLTYLSRAHEDERYDVRAALYAALYLRAHYTMADPRPTPQDTAHGAYDFDSLLEPVIRQVAEKNEVHWCDLMTAMAASHLDKTHITTEVLCDIARAL
jgi:4-hydroxy 2-oxovalerate aldolase